MDEERLSRNEEFCLLDGSMRVLSSGADEQHLRSPALLSKIHKMANLSIAEKEVSGDA
jgi:hypothetical protein